MGYQGKKRGPNPREQREKLRVLFLHEHPPGSQAEVTARMTDASAEPENMLALGRKALWIHSPSLLCSAENLNPSPSCSSVPFFLQPWLLSPTCVWSCQTLFQGQQVQEPRICIQAFH